MLKENLNIKNVINYIPVLGNVILLSFSIFYINKFRDLWYIVPATFLLEFIYNERWKDFNWNEKKIYYIVIILFFSFYFIYFPFEENLNYHYLLLRNRTALLGLAIVGFLGINSTYHKLSIYLHTFIITSFVIILYLIFIKIGFYSFITSQDKTTLFMMTRITWVNSHMMFNLYLNISLLCIWYILSNKHQSMLKNSFYGICYLLFFYILSISEGRSGFFMSLLITGCILFIEIYKRNRLIAILCSIFFIALSVQKIVFHPRTSTKIETEPRIFLWKNAFSIIKEKPILGWGANSAQSEFTKRIWQDTTGTVQAFWQPTDFVDSHNQFIQATMEFGIIGFLVLLFIYIAPYLLVNKQRKILCLLIFVVLTFQSVFDMFITGQFASLFMMITFMLFMTKEDTVTLKPLKSNK